MMVTFDVDSRRVHARFQQRVRQEEEDVLPLLHERAAWPRSSRKAYGT